MSVLLDFLPLIIFVGLIALVVRTLLSRKPKDCICTTCGTTAVLVGRMSRRRYPPNENYTAEGAALFCLTGFELQTADF